MQLYRDQASTQRSIFCPIIPEVKALFGSLFLVTCKPIIVYFPVPFEVLLHSHDLGFHGFFLIFLFYEGI